MLGGTKVWTQKELKVSRGHQGDDSKSSLICAKGTKVKSLRVVKMCWGHQGEDPESNESIPKASG